METNRVCYFCGNYGTDEHHVLPIAVSKYLTELSHGTFRLESIAKIWLCNSCHRKFHKIVHPLTILGLIDARNPEMLSLEKPEQNQYLSNDTIRSRYSLEEERVLFSRIKFHDQIKHRAFEFSEIREFAKEMDAAHVQRFLEEWVREGVMYQPLPNNWKLTNPLVEP